MASSPSCSTVINIYLGISPDGIILFGLDWSTTPLGSQIVAVQYRVTGDPTWLNAFTNLNVDIYGNIEGAELVVVGSPVAGESYDVQVFNQCGGLAYQTVFIYPEEIFSGSYLVDNGIYNICGNEPIVLYSNEPFDVGTVMYTNLAMTTPITGYNFIADSGTGIIHALNFATGVVGASTGYTCNVDTPLQVILGNNTGTICSGTIVEVYTSGIAEVGSTLFLDEALYNKVTGYDYVLFLDDNIIYNLNNATGVVGASTGLSCTANGGNYQYSVVLDDIADATPVKLYTPGSFGHYAVMYTDYAMTTELTGFNYISIDGIIRDINETTGVVGCISVNC